MDIDIKHKHAGHLIIIQEQSFKANGFGMWNLTDIWQTLKLPKTKRPSRWRDKEAKVMGRIHNLDTVSVGATPVTKATKRATLKYAAWVSPEFETMVYDAFEAVLEMPEVALLVSEKMAELGRVKSAEIMKRIIESDKDARYAAFKLINKDRRPRQLTAEEHEMEKAIRRAKYHARKHGYDY